MVMCTIAHGCQSHFSGFDPDCCIHLLLCMPNVAILPVMPVHLTQALEGTVLQQLQAQSDKLSAVAQAMSHHAAECIEDSGLQVDQPAAELDAAAAPCGEACTLDTVGC
jgi:hypothetical protein